ncbi:hypothetical protein IT570_04250 [Candidatus Sumerlaeota bacterium]|nr:hypothetical protein [Candidatus Sumerlaeota bacterium]
MIKLGRAFAGSAVKKLHTAVLAAALIAPTGLFAATDMSKQIPNNALIAGWTNDANALRESAKVSPYGKLWNDPSMEKVRQRVEAEFKKMQEERGEKEFTELSEVIDLLKGGVGFYLKPQGGEFDTKNLTFTAIAEVDEKGKAWLDEKLKDFGKDVKDAKKDSFETNGVTVYRVKGLTAGGADTPAPDPAVPPAADGTTPSPAATPATALNETTMQYALVDNKFFVFSDAKDEEIVKEAINMVKAPSAEKGLAGREDVKLAQSKSQALDSQLHVFVDTGTLLRKFIENDPNVEPEVREKIPTTGLFDIKALHGIMTMTEKSMDMDIAVSTPAEKNGLVKALYAGGPTSLKMVKYVPATALTFSSFTLDLGAVYDETLKIVQGFQPQLASMATMQISGASAQYEVDIVNGILRNIAGEHMVVTSPLSEEIKKQLPPGQGALMTSDACYFGLKNGDQVQASLKTLLANLKKDPATADMFTMEEKEGITVVYPKTGEAEDGPLKPVIAFNKDAIAYTNNDAELQNVIRALNGKIAEPLSATDGYKKTVEGISKDGLYAFTYQPKGSVRAGLRQISEMASQGFFNMLEGFTPDMIPAPEVAEKYFGDSFSTVTFEEKQVSVKTRALAPTPK